MAPDDDDDLQPGIEPPEEVNPADAGDAAAVKKKRTKREVERQQVARFWKQVFAHPVGRKAMFGILQELGTFRVQFAASPTGVPDPNATWYHNGRRDAGLKFYHEWTLHDRDGVFAMLDELDPRFKKGE